MTFSVWKQYHPDGAWVLMESVCSEADCYSDNSLAYYIDSMKYGDKVAILHISRVTYGMAISKSEMRSAVEACCRSLMYDQDSDR